MLMGSPPNPKISMHGTPRCHHAFWAACRFALLCKIRVARLFGSLDGRQNLVSMRLLAFYVLVQSSPSQDEVASFFSNEPEFVGELVSLLQAEKQVPEPIRVYTLRALAVQVGRPLMGLIGTDLHV